MNIVIAGPKGSGKSTFGRALAESTGLPFVETDTIIEELHKAKTCQSMTCREIFRFCGEDTFRDLEEEAVQDAVLDDWHVVITGGSTLLNPDSRRTLRSNGLLIYLQGDPAVLWDRATAEGVPPWLEGAGGEQRFVDEVNVRDEVLLPFADIVLDTTESTTEELVAQAQELISQELTVRARSANTYGDIVRLTTFGESHGEAIGCVLDGIRPDVEISDEIIMEQMNRRKPGQSKVVTQRKEDDQVHIVSGVFEGRSTGAPIGMIIYNKDQRGEKYDIIRDLFRPGHADYTFYKKYGLRDHRGGGRSSARETALRVASGAIARNILKRQGVEFVAHSVEIAGIRAETCDYDVIESNPVRCADPVAAKEMEEAILAARKDQDSVGGIIQLDILGVPAGLGDPVFGKLDARLTYALMTIGAFKGVEVGDGFASTKLRGSEHNDGMKDGKFLSNHGGGITGGISTGQTIVMRIAAKPTSSIARPQETIDIHGHNRTIEVHGRHDPCIVPRAVPVIENMAALVILDAWEIQCRLNPKWPPPG